MANKKLSIVLSCLDQMEMSYLKRCNFSCYFFGFDPKGNRHSSIQSTQSLAENLFRIVMDSERQINPAQQ